MLASRSLSPDRDGETVVYNGGGVFLGGSRFEVSGGHAERLLQTLPAVILLRQATDQAMLRWSIEMMMQELREARPGAALVAQQLAHMMLVQTLRLSMAQTPEDRTGWLAALAHLQLDAGSAGRNGGNVADGVRAPVSGGHGGDADRYATRWRMIIAAERLLSARMSLGEIAQAVGYESENAFNVAFKRVVGAVPRRYARGANEAR